ncbi:MAG: hypothetical protein H6684_16705, partial [Deltaproteobacteria bacterium]|nr:hypothetical protein [Deltaproteobacteria bacterium]
DDTFGGDDDDGDDDTDFCENNGPPFAGFALYADGAALPEEAPAVDPSGDVEVRMTYNDVNCNLGGGRVLLKDADGAVTPLATLPIALDCSSDKAGEPYAFTVTGADLDCDHSVALLAEDDCGAKADERPFSCVYLVR